MSVRSPKSTARKFGRMPPTRRSSSSQNRHRARQPGTINNSKRESQIPRLLHVAFFRGSGRWRAAWGDRDLETLRLLQTAEEMTDGQ